MKEYKPSGNGRQKRIGQKVGQVVVIILAISIFVTVALSVTMFRSLTTKLTTDRCVNATNMLEYALDGADRRQDINQLLDELKSRMDCEFTIFEGDTRAYTTVMQDGQRVVGTKLSGDVAEIVLQQGKAYVGRATILNEEYLCSYVPTRDASGQVNGLLFAGISNTEANQQTIRVVLFSAVVGFGAIVLSVLILTVYLKKQVSGPLAQITQVAHRLEQGDLGLATGEAIRVSVHSNDEIGELGRVFEMTIQRMRAYIGEISDVLGAISNGDLTHSARQEYVGDFRSIRQSLDEIDTKLNSTMRQIRESAGQVSFGSEQVSSSSQALSQGAVEQASAVEELSATIGGIAQDAQRTAQITEEVSESVNQASHQLHISMDYVQQLNMAMEHISTSSDKISEIISAIESIAFQTNILALNAAVEAAQAGSAGKGFAVVANEVRNLASKSDEAAKATKELIESSITAVQEGSSVANEVTKALEKTNDIANDMTSKMAVVVEAVESQTTAISQVTEGIEQISAVVQTNSATSEQSAATSEELSSQASLLERLVSSFHLKGAH